MNVTKYIRLLPAVVLLGTGLLAIKSVDIARAAQGVVAPAADPDQPDNAGLAPSDPTARPRPDFAEADGTNSSAAEVDVMSSLSRRRAELDARERGLAMRENLLNAGEARVDQKIAALKQLQGDIQGLLSQRDAKQDAQIASLVKTYSAMKPKDAARIFNSLSDDVLLPVAKGMKSDVLAPVLAAMNADAAQKLTVKLAALLKLPDTAPATLCPTPAVTADATPAATPGATPPAVQTAALTPPQVTPLPTPPAPAVTPAVQTAAASPPPAAAPVPAKPAPAAAKPEPKKPVAHRAPPKPAVTVTPKAVSPAPSSPAPATTPPAAAPASPPAGKPATPAASGPPTSLGAHQGG